MNLACLIVWLWLEGNVSLLVRYFYLSISPDDDANTYVASAFTSLSIVMISVYILSKTLHRKRKGLSDARVASFTKKEYDFAVHFL